MYDPSTYDRPSDQPTAPAHDHEATDDCPAACPAHAQTVRHQEAQEDQR